MRNFIIIIILVLIVGGVWFSKSKNVAVVDKTIAFYNNSSLGISFTYPKILTASTTSGVITLHHEVPFVHHDYCDFKGEIDTTINTLTDFDVKFFVQNRGLVETMKTVSPYIPQENFIDDAVIESPGFIDKYSAGKLNGYKIFEGAEGCGQTTYYFPISDTKTLVVQEALVTVFTGAINKEKSAEIFDSILVSLKVQ